MSSGASLNHIFRTVWNQALGAMVAVAEVGTSAGRSSGRRSKSDSLCKPPEVGIGLLALSVATAWSAFVPSVHANPTGAIAIVGQATVVNNGNAMQVTTQNGVGTNFSAINWQSFSIPAGSSTHFLQPNASSTSINRVVTNTPSQLFGSLSSNGTLVLVNHSGIAVGAGAMVDTAGFTASSVAMSDQDAMAGRLRFGDGSISTSNLNVNGNILARSGDVVLLGPNVQAGQAALIQAPNGSTILAAGQQIDITGRGLEGIRLQVQAPTDSVVNLGALQGDAVAMFAGTLKHSGLIQASTAALEGGRVVLKAMSDTYIEGQASVLANSATGAGGSVEVLGHRVALTDNAHIDVSGATSGGTILIGGDYQGKNTAVQNANITYVGKNTLLNADATGAGNGGKVIVWADDITRAYGNINARGGQTGGDGGFVENSGKNHLDFQGRVNTTAAAGKTGVLLLDPSDIVISTGANQFITGTTPFTGTSTGGSVLNVATLNTALGSSAVVVDAAGGTGGTGNITVSDPVSSSSYDLTLTAGPAGVIAINAPITTMANLVLNGSNGGITQSGAGVITAASLTANSTGSFSTITLSNGSNAISSFTGSTNGYGANITVNNSGPLSLGSVSVPQGSLAITTANGAITQSGAIVVLYGTSLNAGTGSINLPLVSNDFSTLTVTGGQILVQDTNNLILSGVTATGTVEARALGNLTLSGNASNSAAGNAISFVVNGLFNASGGLISTPNGRWLAYLANSSLGHTYGSNSPAFKQYNATFGSSVIGTGNGVLDARVPFLSGSVTGSVSKTYDGSTTISPSGASVGGLVGALGADDLTSATVSPASANLSDPNVGTGKAVTVTGTVGGVIGGSLDFDFFNKPIYGYQFSGSGNIGTVTAAQASVSLTGSRAYDGTNLVNANIFSLSGLAPNETLTLSGAGSVADKNVGSNKTVSLDTLTLGNGTGLASNYTFSGGTAVATITPATISDITGIVATNKVYDGSTSAALTTSNVNFVGLFGSDVLTVAGATGTFADKTVGVGKSVVVSNVTLGGADAGNYCVCANVSGTTADITAKALTLSNIDAATKVYDGTTTAVASNIVLAGTVLGDMVSLAFTNSSFDTKNVGTAKQVTFSGIKPAGVDGGNYTLSTTSASAVADITPRPLSVSGVQVLDKIYDGKADASVNFSSAVLQGAVAGDAVSIADVSGKFADKNVGTGKTVMLTSVFTGADLANYAVADQKTAKANISPKPLTLAPTVDDKPFDNSTVATVSGYGLNGFVSGESVGVTSTSATFDSANVGANKLVSISGISLINGTGMASNYSVPRSATARATIFDPLSLNVVNLVTVFLEKFETALEDQRDRKRSEKDRGLDNIVVEGDICLR